MPETDPVVRTPTALIREGTTALDRLGRSRLNNAIELLRTARAFRRAYINYIGLGLRYLTDEPFPFIARIRGGGTALLRSRSEAALYSSVGEPNSRISHLSVSEDGVVSFRYRLEDKEREVSFAGLLTNGDPWVFVNEEYRGLPVVGKSVVDVGASIGESAIYFALRGARAVYAYEPFPNTFDLAKKNIEQNGLSTTVCLDRSAIGARPGVIRLRDSSPSAYSRAEDRVDGTETAVKSLSEIINKRGIADGVLKMDCEGAEYDAILESDSDTLRAFAHIQVEYHYGFRALKTKLERAGFHVRQSGPQRHARRRGELPMYFGFLHANRERFSARWS